MNARNRGRARMRAAFGAGFVVLGAVLAGRLVLHPGSASAKVLGVALGVAMIALGIARIAAYVRVREETAA